MTSATTKKPACKTCKALLRSLRGLLSLLPKNSGTPDIKKAVSNANKMIEKFQEKCNKCGHIL